MFDPNDFKNSSTSEAGSTSITPCPTGEWPARVDKVDFREVQGSKDPSKTYVFCDVTYLIDSDEVRRAVERDRVTVRQSIIVDLAPSGKGLDMSKGKNVALNRVRDAAGQNVPGQPWAPGMLEGKPLRVKVVHRPDPRDSSNLFADVAGVAPL